MLKFNRELNVPTGVETRLSPLVSHILAPNPGPFTFKGTGVYLVGAGADRGGDRSRARPWPSICRP